MSKELIEQLAKEKAQEFKFSELGCELHAKINCGDISANALMDIVYRTAYTEAYQAAAPIDNVSKNSGSSSAAAAVLPNGKTCTNVYEAYYLGVDEGLFLAAKLCEENNVAISCKGGKHTLMPHFKEDGSLHAGMTYADAIRALIPDTQATQTQALPK
jgi:hypothetical protein